MSSVSAFVSERGRERWKIEAGDVGRERAMWLGVGTGEREQETRVVGGRDVVDEKKRERE